MRSLFLLFVLALPLPAADIQVYPPVVQLQGRSASQRLLVVEEVDGRALKDHTGSAKFISNQPAIVTVSPAGELRALADGQATVSIRVGERQVDAQVRVTGAGSNASIRFRHDVESLLTRAGCNSGACHGALAGKGGLKLSLRGYDPESDFYVLTRQAKARRVDLTEPANSLLLKKAARLMPHAGGKRIEPESESFQMLLDWIRAGAPGPRADDPRLERIELFPKKALLKPQDSLQVLVQGHYSDGTVRDVSPWARFGSSEDLVATVDEAGQAKVSGHGEASITVTFGTKVAAMTITSPFPAEVAAKTYIDSPRFTLVDDHVIRKLQLLHLVPSPQAQDSVFIRRAYLDVCGILPTPAEVANFVKDTSPKKREQLIEQLLNRPEYVDYWTHKWSELLLVSTRKLPQPAMWSFYRFVRQNVSDNVPWDRFARSVLTASGSTLTNGAANYYVLHKDVSELVETTSVTFLGMSITCARCHNHPLEKWTQDDYWSLANLFSRVGLKDGDRAGDVIVQNLSTGEALHLRRGVPMPPAPLDAPPLPSDGPADRRVYFANWLTSAKNPYFAKAVVNRVWRNFMGRGLVEPEDDLRETNPSSNPELFEALTRDFIDHNYDMKHLIRTIMSSAAYQRSSEPTAGNEKDERFASRYLPRRLAAEVILDAYSDVTGVASKFDQFQVGASGGFAATSSFPKGTRAIQLPDALLVSQFLDAFGRAERVQTCSCERTADSSVTQALHLNNGQTLNDKLRDPASKVSQWFDEKRSNEEMLSMLYQRALCREPSSAEKTKLLPILAEASKSGPVARREAIEDLVWAVLTSQEFLFNR